MPKFFHSSISEVTIILSTWDVVNQINHLTRLCAHFEYQITLFKWKALPFLRKDYNITILCTDGWLKCPNPSTNLRIVWSAISFSYFCLISQYFVEYYPFFANLFKFIICIFAKTKKNSGSKVRREFQLVGLNRKIWLLYLRYLDIVGACGKNLVYFFDKQRYLIFLTYVIRNKWLKILKRERLCHGIVLYIWLLILNTISSDIL